MTHSKPHTDKKLLKKMEARDVKKPKRTLNSMDWKK